MTELIVDFYADDADIGTRKYFFKLVDLYDGLCIGHEKQRTTSLFFPRGNPLNIKKIQNDLGDIKILEIL